MLISNAKNVRGISKLKKIWLCTIKQDTLKTIFAAIVANFTNKKKSALNEHIRIKHEKTAKMVSCNVCEKQVYRVSHLQDHLNTHFQRTPHRCQKCKRVYHSHNSLQLHTQDCSGKVPTCGICKRTFSSGNTLADHEKSEHGGKVYT